MNIKPDITITTEMPLIGRFIMLFRDPNDCDQPLWSADMVRFGNHIMCWEDQWNNFELSTLDGFTDISFIIDNRVVD